jgi:hypothetical protein
MSDIAKLLQDWVRAEIEYALASSERDAEGYTLSCSVERDIADSLFEKIQNLLDDVFKV